MARLLVLLFALCAAPLTAQQVRHAPPLRLLSVSPAPNATQVADGSAIVLRFAQPLDLSSLGPRDLHVWGRWSGAMPFDTTVLDAGRTLRLIPRERFSAGEQVTVTLSRHLRDHIGRRRENGTVWSFWIASRPSSSIWTLRDVLTPGSVPYGAYGGDIDADGDLDLCVPNEGSSDVSVFVNQGLDFSPAVSYPAGDNCSANEGADLNFDGHLDLVVENILDDDVSVFLGNGDGTFQPQVRYSVGDEPRGLALFDADGDGDIDIATANRQSSDMSLLLNRGDGRFRPERRFEGGVLGEKSCCAADMNGDGIPDLVVVGIDDDSLRTLLGDGRGNFTPGPITPIGDRPWMVVAADYTGDGDTDVGVALSGTLGAVEVCAGDGQGGFGTPQAYFTGSFTIAVDFGDLNGDGRLDLTGSSFLGGVFTLFLNSPAGGFAAHQPLFATGAASCTVLHDVDGDGDLDVTAIDEVDDKVYLFTQDG